MREVWWVVCAVLLGSGCKKEQPVAPVPPPREAPAGADAPDEAASNDDGNDGKPYVLTREKLDAYVSYQRAVQASYASYNTLMRELQAGRPRRPGADGAPDTSAAMKAIEGKAELEDKARRDVGLSEQDVNRIGALVTDVITQRHMAAMLDLSGELQKLEQMQARLKPEQAAELTPQLTAMRQRLQETERLTEVRRVHGDANVDLVLTREQDLMNNYQEMLRSFGGRAQ